MNYTTAVFLINKHVRAVAGTYEAEDNAKRTTFKTLDETLAVGDFVIVPTDTRHKMTIVKIVETDIDIDFDSPAPVHWVIGRIDAKPYAEMLAHENQAINAIKAAELRKKRDDLRKTMLAEHLDAIKALPIAALNGDAKPDPAV